MGHKITKSNCHSVFRQIKNHLDSEQSESSKYKGELGDNISFDNKIQKIKRMKQFFKGELSDLSSFPRRNFEKHTSEKLLSDVQFELKSLILDLVDHPPLFEDFLQKIKELKVKIKSERYSRH